MNSKEWITASVDLKIVQIVNSMKCFWLTLAVICIFSTVVNSQAVSSSVTNKQAKTELKAEQKKEKERRKKEGKVKKEEEDMTKAKPWYKRIIKHRKKVKDKKSKILRKVANSNSII